MFGTSPPSAHRQLALQPTRASDRPSLFRNFRCRIERVEVSVFRPRPGRVEELLLVSAGGLALEYDHREDAERESSGLHLRIESLQLDNQTECRFPVVIAVDSAQDLPAVEAQLKWHQSRRGRRGRQISKVTPNPNSNPNPNPYPDLQGDAAGGPDTASR